MVEAAAFYFGSTDEKIVMDLDASHAANCFAVGVYLFSGDNDAAIDRNHFSFRDRFGGEHSFVVDR